MFDRPEILQMAGAMASHAAVRQGAIAQNIANADTPGYAARDVASFAESYEAEAPGALRATRAGHLAATASAYLPEVGTRARPGTESPNGNSVSLETEMVHATEAKREHDLALAIYRSSLGILRGALGRGS